MADFLKTVNQLVDIILARCRSEIGTSAPLYAQTLTDFNLALQEIAILHTWKWMKKEVTLTIPAGTRQVNAVSGFPTDVINYNELFLITGGRSTPLILISEELAADLYPDLAATGTPIHYVIGAPLISTTIPPKRTIELRPAPASDMTLTVSYTYTFKLYTSAEGAEVPPIPQNYYSPLIELVAARLFTHIKNPRYEIEKAEQKGLMLLKQLAKKDSDLNKGMRSIRLPRSMEIYRASRYS
jgi:hypothetical protein